MRNIDKKIMCGGYILAYTASFLFAQSGHAYTSGAILMLTAVGLYCAAFLESGNLVDLKGLFSLSWVFGQGVACLQLSRLQKDWSMETWLCFFLAYICFCFGYDWNRRNGNVSRMSAGKQQEHKPASKTQEPMAAADGQTAKKVMVCIVVLAVLSILCFLLEAVVVGYIPLFSELPHAYSYFHISGVHYFTISCILIPALTVIYTKVAVQRSKKTLLLLGLANITAVGIPVLCVSRFQLIFAVSFAIVTYLLVYRKITWKMVMVLIILMVPSYILLTVARNHDVSYLNGIFEMKYQKMPIFVTQPYMYIANNYENFNCMVEQIGAHTYGLRMLFPVFALTGLKFVFPQLVSFPIFITKQELTTLTVFYDAYYDFGMVGIVLFALLLGLLGRVLTKAVKQNTNPMIYLFYGQIAIYFALSFFTTWFSNPTTWFWLGLTVLMYLYVEFRKKERK